MAKEDQSLLGGKYFNNARTGNIFWPNKFRTCLWCVLFILVIGVTALIVYDTIKFFKRNSEDNDTDMKAILKLGVYSNISDLRAANEQLCKKVSDKDKTISSNGPSNIYIIKSERNLTNEQACGIESILRLFPDKTIYLIDFNKFENKHYEKCSSTQNYLGLLLYLYKDRLKLLPANRNDYFRHTPLQKYPMAAEDFVFSAMVLTAYKFGGFVASTNVIMINRDLLECLPEETIVDPDVIITSKICDNFLHYLMQSFSLCKRDNSTLEEFMNGSIKVYSQSHGEKATVRRLSQSEVCNNTKKPCTFLRLQQCNDDPSKWLGDLSGYCKQVVQAFLGIKVNQMEVEEETSRMRSKIGHGGRKCDRTDGEEI